MNLVEALELIASILGLTCARTPKDPLHVFSLLKQASIEIEALVKYCIERRCR